MRVLRFFALLLFVLLSEMASSADVLFTTSDYSTSALGIISNSGVAMKNSFADGNPWLIPFSDGGGDKLAVALRGSGVLRVYDQTNLEAPIAERKIGANIQNGIFYDGNLFILDKGDSMSGKGDAKLYKMDARAEVQAELDLQTANDEYKFYAEKIIESGGALFALLQRYKTLPATPWIEHKEGELVKISLPALTVEKRWTLNKNPMEMELFNGEIYIISMGGAQGVSGNVPKLEVINAATESEREIPLWNIIPAEMNEPQKMAADYRGGEIYIAVSSVMNPTTYETKSEIYKFNPNDISRTAKFASFPNGTVTCMEHDGNGNLMALFSDYSTFLGSIKIYSNTGGLIRDYSSTELGGNAYQAIFSNSTGGENKIVEIGGCNSAITSLFGILIIIPLLLNARLRSKKLPPSAKPCRGGGSFLICLLLFASVANAAIVDVAEETVVGSKIQEAADYSTGAVTIVEAKNLIGTARDLPELLRQVPGLRITELRGRGQYSVASVRGSSASQVAVYIDGQLANLGSDAAVNLAVIPVENLERIEVYRGYIPARFGVAGLGGVINIVTRALGDDESKTRLGLGFGSFGEARASFSWAGKLAGGDFFFGSQYEGVGGNFSYRNDNATPSNPNDDYTADRKNNGFNRGGALLKWQKNGWSARAEWQINNQELPRSAPGNDKLGEPSGADMATEQLNFQLGKRVRAGAFDMGLSAAWIRQDREFNDPNLTLGSVRWNRYKTNRLAFDYDASVAAGERHFLEFFATHTNETLNIQSKNTDLSSNRTNLVLQDTIALDGAGTFLLSPLVRWNAADGDNASTWNVAVSKQIGEAWLLRGSYGKYVRIPNLYERYGDGGILRPTPDLKWERGDQWDLGFVWNGKLLNGASGLSLTYFNRNSTDLIEFVMFGPYTAAYRNIGEAFVQGFELEASWAHSGWQAEFSATYTDSKNKAADYRNGKRLPNSPEWTAYAKIKRDFSHRFSAFIDAQYISPNYLDYAQHISYDRLVMFGAGVKWNFSKNGTLHFNVKDIFNKGAESQFIHSLTGSRQLAWYPAAGTSFNASLLWEF